jgi:acyl-CoA oxidase
MKMLKRLFLKRTDCNQKTDESHLIDQDFHLLFFNTEKNNFSICSKANKKLIDSGLDPYDDLILCNIKWLMSQAYLERVVLEQFQETIQNIKDKKQQRSYVEIISLYFSQIEKK